MSCGWPTPHPLLSQVAMLLRDDKEANARILVEHIIREDYTLESYEVGATLIGPHA